MKPILSVIYVYYNTPEEIRSSIESLTSVLGKISYEIIIIDNNSIKSLPKELSGKPHVKIIKNNINCGYGKGLNIGAKIARGKYLLLVNPDVEFGANSIKHLLDKIRSDSKIGIVGPQLTNKKNEIIQSISGMPYLPQSLFVFSFMGKIWPGNPFLKKYHNVDLDREKEQEVDAVGGACMLVRKPLFDRVRGFDERFFMYFEEADFCFRIKKLGYKVLYLPNAKVIHLVGKSTQNKEWIEKTFERSRFRFFKKYHGLIPALLGEFILRFFKPFNILLVAILAFSAFLNFYKINERMIFIGDQGWFYLSARDMLLTSKVPLVGITASHTWLHQGPFWTYILAFVLWIFRYNPLSGGYFTAFLGVTTVFLVHKLGKEMFSRRVGLISALLYATSPLVIIISQMPYHTSPIPLLTLCLIYAVFKWIKGSTLSFPLIIFLLALLYNFELATQVFWVSIWAIFTIGFFKKRKWALGVLTKKITFFSVLLFLLPMLPIIIYDVNHGFAQTLKFFAWIPYRAFIQLLNLKNAFSAPQSQENISSMVNFFSINYQQFIFPSSYAISLLILFLSIGYVSYYLLKSRKEENIISPAGILILLITIPLIGFFLNMTPSGAYLPLFFPGAIILTAWVFDKIMRSGYLFVPIIVSILLIVLSNALFVLDASKVKPAYGLYFSERLNTVKKILREADGKNYKIEGEGPGAQFESFTMNYEYLAWWLGKPPSQNSENYLFILSEGKNGISIKKEIIRQIR